MIYLSWADSKTCSLNFESLILTCLDMCLILSSSYLEFVTHPRYLYSHHSWNLVSFQPLFLQIFSLASVFSLRDIHNTYIWLFCSMVPQRPLRALSSSIFIFFLRLDNLYCPMGCSGSSAGKESAYNPGDLSSIPGLERSTGERIGYLFQYSWASLVAQRVKNLPAVWETWVRSLGWEDPWRRERLPSPVFWPREFHGLHSPWDRKDPDMTEWFSLHLIFEFTDSFSCLSKPASESI